MGADSERLLVSLLNDRDVGAFRFRQPQIPIETESGVQRYTQPKQPLDLFAFTTMKIPESFIDEYNLKRYYELEDGYYVDVRLGIEEKRTGKSVLNVSKRIENDRHSRFISYCLKRSLVPVYVFNFTLGSSKSITKGTSRFFSVFINEKFKRRSKAFREDAKRFTDFLPDLLEGYLNNMESWRDDFDVISVVE